MALGKNLNNILGDYFGEENVALNDDGVLSSVVEVPVHKIELSPYQTRREFEQEKIESLAESIKQTGLLSPVILLKKTNISEDGTKEVTHTLLAGERRLRAFKHLQYEKIPAILKEEGNLPKEEQALITAYENIHREDLSPLELAQTFEMLMQTQGLDENELALKLGYSKQYIKNYLKLLSLSEPVQKALLNKKLTEGQARHFVNLSEMDQFELLQEVLEKDLTVKEIIHHLKKQRVSTEEKVNKKVQISNLSQEILNKANRLAEYFPNAKLKSQGDESKGKIVITWG